MKIAYSIFLKTKTESNVGNENNWKQNDYKQTIENKLCAYLTN